MILGAAAMVGMMLLAPVPDGAFVGTFVAADATTLVVRADNGGEETFVLGSGSDMPPGFVTGTRIVVRFETLADGRYRATSVSPPRIPLEADVLTTLPARASDRDPATEPNVSAATRMPSATASVVRESSNRVPPSPAQTASRPATPARTPAAVGPAAVTFPSDGKVVPATRRDAPGVSTRDWAILLGALFGACAMLLWGLRQYR